MLDGLQPRNLLVLDSGNALFRNGGAAGLEELARARLILSLMGRLGTRAMAVGERDLAGGVDFLQAEGRTAGVRPLSANLTRGGKRVFDAALVLEVGGVKVALVGVSAPRPPLAGVEAGPTVPAARAALAALGKRDLTVLLAATSAADAAQLAEQLGGQVDLVLQSGEFRGTVPPQRLGPGQAFLLASGQRGQALATVHLALGAGPWIDLSERERDGQQVTFVRQQQEQVKARLTAARTPKETADLRALLASLHGRELELARLAGPPAPGARTLKLDWVMLSQDVADDPAIKAEVLKVEPTYQGAH